jgi:MFS family permease
MQGLADNWLVFSLTVSALFLGLDAFVQQLPLLLFTLIGGVVADRYDRRRILLGSQYVQLTSAFILGALVYFGAVRIWHILALSFLTGCAQTFGGPASQALIPSLVSPKGFDQCDRAQFHPIQRRTRHWPAARWSNTGRVQEFRHVRGHGAERLLQPERVLVPRRHRRVALVA